MRVFLSYRRDDDPFAVGRVRDFLASSLGDDNVFLDVLSIRSGAHFESVIDETISSSDVVLVVIGSRWEGARRLGSVVDYVEYEVGVAMRKGKRVVPLLLGLRSMPNREALPGSLASLTSINAHRLRPDPDFRSDMQELLEVLGVSPTPQVRPDERKRRPVPIWAAAVAVALVVVVAAVAMRRSGSSVIQPAVSQVTVEVPAGSSGSPSESTGPATTSMAPETTAADPNEGWFPVAEPVVAILTANLIDELPDVADTMRGYSLVELKAPKEEPVIKGLGPLVHPYFEEWASSEASCKEIWWVAQWESRDPSVLVSAELVPASWLQKVDASFSPSEEPAHAGFMSSSGCQVPGFWFGGTMAGSTAAAVDVQIKVALFEIDPGIADCHPMNRNEELPLRLCDRGENVRRMQTELVRRGFGEIEIDGDFGPATERVVRAFQASNDLPDDGVVNTSTWLALFPGELGPVTSTTAG